MGYQVGHEKKIQKKIHPISIIKFQQMAQGLDGTTRKTINEGNRMRRPG
jgi:hypothetical protein